MSHPTTAICGGLGFLVVKAMASLFLTGEIEPQEQMA